MRNKIVSDEKTSNWIFQLMIDSSSYYIGPNIEDTCAKVFAIHIKNLCSDIIKETSINSKAGSSRNWALQNIDITFNFSLSSIKIQIKQNLGLGVNQQKWGPLYSHINTTVKIEHSHITIKRDQIEVLPLKQKNNAPIKYMSKDLKLNGLNTTVEFDAKNPDYNSFFFVLKEIIKPTFIENTQAQMLNKAVRDQYLNIN